MCNDDTTGQRVYPRCEHVSTVSRPVTTPSTRTILRRTRTGHYPRRPHVAGFPSRFVHPSRGLQGMAQP
uniref:Uncharacterized protein n=1 Tax=Oryza brachyantha TaxID=4533 RepID=J3NCM2_ORYBR